MPHLKFNQTLADIPKNPYPVMLVGEHHSTYVQSLVAMRSLQHLQKDGYSQFVIEYNNDEKKIIEGLKKSLIKDGVKALSHIDKNLEQSYMGAAILWQAEALKMGYVFSDHPEKPTNTRWRLQELSNQTGSKQIGIAKSVMTQLGMTDDEMSDKVTVALRYAGLGRKTFDNFQKQADFSADEKACFAQAGEDVHTIYEEEVRALNQIFMMDERNAYIAQKINQTHLSAPRTKKIGYYGVRHVCDVDAASAGNRVIADILREDYNIESTNVVFVDTILLRAVSDSIDRSGLDRQLIDFEEVAPYADNVFHSNVVELYFLLSGRDATEGIHDLRGSGIANADYAFVPPPYKNNEVLDNAAGKIAHLLKLK